MIGQYITLVDKKDGRVTFARVTKVGRKYIYGVPAYYDHQEGRIKEAYYETNWTIEEKHIIPELRQDLQKRYLDFNTSVQTWQTQQTRTEYDFERQASAWVRERMDEWRAENPKPTYDVEAVVKEAQGK